MHEFSPQMPAGAFLRSSFPRCSNDILLRALQRLAGRTLQNSWIDIEAEHYVRATYFSRKWQSSKGPTAGFTWPKAGIYMPRRHRLFAVPCIMPCGKD
jgi:hypothetical protein